MSQNSNSNEDRFKPHENPKIMTVDDVINVTVIIILLNLLALLKKTKTKNKFTSIYH